ncbi:MAG TPA: efflux RND transporter periplasmic adaptor subunit [Gemmatimonadales bacterium]|jgi:membrane fusion protein (multidrug efflux system)|nr:efflux RND transporter periplasmic adaptor subunit [Gemmatimonadales bacterium]
MSRRSRIGSWLLLAIVAAIAIALTSWKSSSLKAADRVAASQPEPTELVTSAVAREVEHRPTTTSIGTVLALRSITLRNELAGTVRLVRLIPGEIVEPGEVLVTLDASVEQAEVEAQEAEAGLAKTTLERLERLRQHQATSQEEVDQAHAARAVALAQIARTKAIIAKKIIRAPFRARVGLADVHPGQYLDEGTQLTTLQSVGDAVHVDFTVAQRVAGGLQVGDAVEVFVAGDSDPTPARIVALDARIDSTTRNALVRAKIEHVARAPAPGASVRVRTATGPPGKAVAVPVSALRKGPQGDHVFVLAADQKGKTRAHLRTVRSGTVVGDDVLIHGGLEAGEQVATSGSFKLREGVLVVVADSAAGVKADAHGNGGK